MESTPGPGVLDPGKYMAIVEFLRWRGHSDTAARAKVDEYQRSLLAAEDSKAADSEA